MSKKSASAQLFSIQPSRLLVRFLLLVHGLAAVAALYNGLPWPYKIATLLFVIINLLWYLRIYHYHYQPVTLKLNEDGTWLLKMADNFQAMQVLPSTVITSWLIALHFRLENGKFQSLLILHDALTEKDYRALVLKLKTAGLADSEI